MAEEPHYSEQTLHLGLITTRQTKKEKEKDEGVTFFIRRSFIYLFIFLLGAKYLRI